MTELKLGGGLANQMRALGYSIVPRGYSSDDKMLIVKCPDQLTELWAATEAEAWDRANTHWHNTQLGKINLTPPAETGDMGGFDAPPASGDGALVAADDFIEWWLSKGGQMKREELAKAFEDFRASTPFPCTVVSCQRHMRCMYQPCLAGPPERDYVSGMPNETNQNLVEELARIIDPSSWAVMDSYLAQMLGKYKGENVAYDPEQYKHKESRAVANAIIPIIARERAAAHANGRADERAVVVGWLRLAENAYVGTYDLPEDNPPQFRRICLHLADAIERGQHLKGTSDE